MLRSLALSFLYSVIALPVIAQIGGQRSFEFVNIPANTRLTALGGVNVSIAGEDINMIFSNPAASGDTLNGMASFNYLSYLAGINAGSFAYQHDAGKYGSWHIGGAYFDYGQIEGYDATGAATSNFDASESLIVVGKSHKIGSYTIGGNVKFMSSSLGDFRSNAIAIDIGGLYEHPGKQLTVGLVFKNVGFVLSDYTTTSDSKLPFDVQLGTSFKPEHMPFRFSFTAYNLYQGDIAYFNSSNPNIEDKPGTADKIFRHLNIGAELLLSKNVNLRVGYNHLVRQELKLDDKSGGAGLSYGLMFKIKAFEFSYSKGGYHASGGSHNFGVAVNTNMFYRKK